MAKAKTIIRWKLNTSDNFMNLKVGDFFFFLGGVLCRNNIYDVNKILCYTRGYVQCVWVFVGWCPEALQLFSDIWRGKWIKTCV